MGMFDSFRKNAKNATGERTARQGQDKKREQQAPMTAQELESAGFDLDAASGTGLKENKSAITASQPKKKEDIGQFGKGNIDLYSRPIDEDHGTTESRNDGITERRNDGKTETAEDPYNKQMSDIDQLMGYYNQYIPIDEEEEQRRIKSAEAIKRLEGFGSIMAGFGNLLTVGRGAQNVVVPEVKPLDVNGYSDRVSALRQNYTKNMMALNQMKSSLQMAKDKNERDKERAALDVQYKQYKMYLDQAVASGKIKKAEAEAKAAEFKAKTEEAKAKYADDKEVAEIERTKAQTRASNSSTSYNNARAAAAQEGNNVVFSSSHGDIKMNKNRLTNANIAKIHKATGLPTTTGDELSPKQKTKEQMLQDIGRMIDDDKVGGKVRAAINSVAGNGSDEFKFGEEGEEFSF